ncbi:uncharacterized protein BKA55DRAFT_533866 [Fusarium redolens]|uniref:Uncharacterized protein n=1 Tax=Fusarium redolens TaxID=48865 RepID=A0A9P9R577_FUSRE|nr:uncharacterized protein BKA55DRAFT_533866 [Fusarium redolens]KAH7267082.1 hypothetical protein BKA55DRAFT_533866 [Fusarium redolens]
MMLQYRGANDGEEISELCLYNGNYGQRRRSILVLLEPLPNKKRSNAQAAVVVCRPGSALDNGSEGSNGRSDESSIEKVEFKKLRWPTLSQTGDMVHFPQGVELARWMAQNGAATAGCRGQVVRLSQPVSETCGLGRKCKILGQFAWHWHGMVF